MKKAVFVCVLSLCAFRPAQGSPEETITFLPAMPIGQACVLMLRMHADSLSGLHIHWGQLPVGVDTVYHLIQQTQERLTQSRVHFHAVREIKEILKQVYGVGLSPKEVSRQAGRVADPITPRMLGYFVRAMLRNAHVRVQDGRETALTYYWGGKSYEMPILGAADAKAVNDLLDQQVGREKNTEFEDHIQYLVESGGMSYDQPVDVIFEPIRFSELPKDQQAKKTLENLTRKGRLQEPLSIMPAATGGVQRALKKAGIQTLGDLQKWTVEMLNELPGCNSGQKIAEWMKSWGMPLTGPSFEYLRALHPAQITGAKLSDLGFAPAIVQKLKSKKIVTYGQFRRATYGFVRDALDPSEILAFADREAEIFEDLRTPPHGTI